MSRPDFPKPYSMLTANMISRIRSDQDAYDKDPEAAERAQRQAKEDRLREYEEERREYERYLDAQRD